MSEPTLYTPGQRIAKRYLVHALKPGVIADVFLCLDEHEGVPLALKRLRLEGFERPGNRALFEAELGVWRGLGRHPHIVRCRHLDVLDAHAVIVMDWIASDDVHGVSLRDYLRTHGALSIRQALDVVMAICRALMHAMRRHPGFVHRDLKAENVLLLPDGVARVTDFGVAQLTERLDDMLAVAGGTGTSSAGLTHLGGAPWYMAPEQWLGEPLDGRTDVYAIGCMLHEMLTGHRPYEVRALPKLRASHLNSALPSADTHSHLPAQVSRIILRCMQKRPVERFDDVHALLIAFEAVYEDATGSEPRQAPSGDAIQVIDYNNRGLAFRALNRNAPAIADFDRAIEIDPHCAAAYLNRADTLVHIGRVEQALADYDRSVDLDAHNATACARRGVAKAKRGAFDAALADLDRAQTIAPGNAWFACDRADILVAAGRFDEALAEYRRALALNDRCVDAYMKRGQLLARLGHLAEARADLDCAFDLTPRNVAVLKLRGQLLEEAGDLEQALASYEYAVSSSPDCADLHASRARVLSALGRNDSAMHALSRALELDEAHYESYLLRASLHAINDEDDEALRDASRAIEIAPSDARGFIHRGQLLSSLERHYDAVQDFTRAVSLMPDSPLGYEKLAGALDAMGEHHEALASYQRLLELKPDDGAIHLQIGLLHHKHGRSDEALQFFRRASNLGETRAQRFILAAEHKLGLTRGVNGVRASNQPSLPQGVTIETLTNFLRDARLSYEVASDGRITIVDRYRYWLLLDTQSPPRFIRQLTTFEFASHCSQESRFALANRINTEVAAIRAAVAGKQLFLDNYLWIDDAIDTQHLLRCLRRFQGLVEESLRRNVQQVLV